MKNEEASLTSLRERLAKTKKPVIYAGAFLDGESDSKCEKEPRGCKYKKNPANHHDVLGLDSLITSKTEGYGAKLGKIIVFVNCVWLL